MENNKNIHENIKQIANLIKKQMDLELEEFDLTFAQSNILMYVLLNKDNEVNQKQIEQEFCLSNPTVNGLLNRLENKNLIKRVNNNKDKRIKNILPLPKAFQFMEKIKTKKDLIEKTMLKNISETELQNLYKILKKISINLKESIDERTI